MKKMNKVNQKSVKWVLLSLNLCDYTHVCVREHKENSFVPVGGGHPGQVIRRFGNRLVVDSYICDNILFLYVLPLFQVSDHWGDYCDIGCMDGGMRVCACAGSCSSCSAADGVTCPLDCEVDNGV